MRTNGPSSLSVDLTGGANTGAADPFVLGSLTFAARSGPADVVVEVSLADLEAFLEGAAPCYAIMRLDDLSRPGGGGRHCGC